MTLLVKKGTAMAYISPVCTAVQMFTLENFITCIHRAVAAVACHVCASNGNSIVLCICQVLIQSVSVCAGQIRRVVSGTATDVSQWTYAAVNPNGHHINMQSCSPALTYCSNGQ